ncbi:MAG: hypothetical protein ACRD5F_14010 [Candidatus Acidiferrales bacterium]
MPAVRVSFLILSFLLLPGVVAAQAKADQTSAVVPAESLEYGIKLHDHADPALVKWAHGFIEKNFRWKQPNLDYMLDEVDRTFALYNGRTRDAVTYLLVYLAYRDQIDLAENFTQHLHDNALEAETIQHELQLWQNYNIQPSAADGQPPGMRNADDLAARMAARLQALETETVLRSNQLIEIRQRVNFTLFVLDEAYRFMKSVPPATLQGVRPGE